MKERWFLVTIVVTGAVVLVLVNVPFWPTSKPREASETGAHPHQLRQGVYCLIAAFQTLGIKTDFEEVFESAQNVASGDVMARLLQVARNREFHAERVQMTVNELEAEKKPAIVKIKDSEFVLIDEFVNGQPRIIDSSDFPHFQKAPYLLPKREFKTIWAGEALLLDFLIARSATPQIRFDNARYDFGVLHAGTKVNHIFRFQNDGKTPLVVSAVKTSCSCTASLTSKQEIKPGEIGKIEVTYSLSGGGNRTTQEIFVHSNSVRHPITTLTITGLTKQPPKVIPGSIVFKCGGKETNLEKQLAVTIPPGSQMHITKIEASSPAIEAKILPNGQNYAQVKLSVSLKCDFKPRFKETLIIYTDYLGANTIEVPIICEKLDRVTIVPSTVLFGMIRAGQDLSRQVLISAKGTNEFEIVEVLSKSPYLSTLLTPFKEKQQYRLTVTVEKEAPIGSFRDTILLKTNMRDPSEIPIPIYGIIGKR